MGNEILYVLFCEWLSSVNCMKLSYVLQLASFGNHAESDKKCLKVLLKVSKKAELYYRQVLFQMCERDQFIC